tara:strand:+ start:1481 stop:1738 length:258 start_codon:yes stop_codon:yes gene_type:complete
MITSDTAQAFLNQLNKNCAEDDAYTLKVFSKFCEKEPHFSAFIASVHSKQFMTDPVSASLLSLSLYIMMRGKQDETDKLNSGIGG